MASLDHAPHIDEQLSAYIDGELTADERRAVDEHLEACSDCRKEYEQLRQVVELASEGLRAVRCLSPADKAAYLHGILDDGRRSEIDQHLERCKRCREEVQQLRQWIEDDPAPQVQPAVRRKRSRANYLAVFAPLAAAAALVVAFASILIQGSSPAIQSMNVRVANTRDVADQANVQVLFGKGCGLHTNDQIQFAVDFGAFRHAALFLIDANGNVKSTAIGQVEGSVMLPAAGSWWRLGSATGTDAMLIAFSKKPFDPSTIDSTRQALSLNGPLPVLPYGSMLWLDQNGRWIASGTGLNEKAMPAPTAQFDSLLSTLNKALSSGETGRNVVCRGFAFAHE